MPDYCVDCPASYSKCPQCQDMGRVFWLEFLQIAWKGILVFIYVICRYRTIILMKYEKNQITIFMSFGT